MFKKLFFYISVLMLLSDNLVISQIRFPDFYSVEKLNIISNAYSVDGKLRLTKNTKMQRGAIWFQARQVVADTFETIFRFQLTGCGGLGGRADGFAFVIQNSGDSVIGLNGGGIGYSGIVNSVAIEFDTYKNSDPNNNHISIQSRGTLANSHLHTYSLGYITSIPNLANGSIYQVKISYAADTIKVYFSDFNSPVLSVPINLGSLLSLDSGKAWVGFTASTGNGYENHDILCWSFDTTFSADTPPAIVFVPGIMGSSLCDSTAGKEDYLWIDLWQLALQDDLFLLPLQLASNGQDPMFPSYHIRVSPRANGAYTPEQELARKPLSYYKELFDSLTTNYDYKLDNFDIDHTEGENLFIFPYDWRKSIKWNGEQLSYFIDSVNTWSKANQVNIVAHSMGGLIAKECVRSYDKNRINQIIFVGTPHLGAPKIDYVLFMGDLNGLLGIAATKAIIKTISKNMPSAYQLMPSNNYLNTDLNHGQSSNVELYNKYFGTISNTGFNYEEIMAFHKTSTFLGIPEFNSDLINQAITFHNNFLNVDFDEISLFNIAGYGKKTIGHVLFSNLPIGERAYASFNLNGDGAVPLRSAEIVNTSITKANYYVNKVKHVELLNNKSVVNLVCNLLKSPPDTLSPLGSNISKDPPASYAVSSFFGLKISSPVSINVYDSQGRHTGPIDDSTWETEIPESDYDSGPNTDPESPKIIFVPLGDDYNVIITSQDTAAYFRLTIDEIQEGQLIGSICFDSIPTDINTGARLQVSRVTSGLLLEVDMDGDAIFETKAYPSIAHTKQTVNVGWNLISLPVQPLDSNRAILYPSSVSNAFSYRGSYLPDDTLAMGKGFWLKFVSSDTISFWGLTKHVDTIAVAKGWNIIGSLSHDIATSTITSVPADIINSEFFSFNESYFKADTIRSGQSYWIKVNSDGELILDATK
ncbi:MAG: alpha/beta hydrolase [Patescibacteria group bacterium]